MPIFSQHNSPSLLPAICAFGLFRLVRYTRERIHVFS